jgi:uncharacterized protein YprB with RNaseH-like and TPR domain
LIARTFVHLPRIGYGTERRLWRSGVRSWEDLVARSAPPKGISQERWRDLQREVRASRAALGCLDHVYFSRRLPSRDHWRTFERFRRKIAYLDIETTGLGSWADITVVGLYDGLSTRTYIHGENLDELAEDLAQHALLVTYNGATFDLPFLRRRFPRVVWDHLHIDLRYPLKRLGHSGGLKSIERARGLQRSPDIAHLDGFDAVRLWNEYQAGSDEALELLVKYNAADIINLETLAERAYAELSAQVIGEIEDR